MRNDDAYLLHVSRGRRELGPQIDPCSRISILDIGAANALFLSGKLNDVREWKRIAAEVKEQFPQLHYLIYLDGLDCDSNYFNEGGDTIKKLAHSNLYAPIFAVSSFLEMLRNVGQVAIIVNRNCS